MPRLIQGNVGYGRSGVEDTVCYGHFRLMAEDLNKR